jgi:WD40 repeat protein
MLIGYMRVSTADQSLDPQRDALLAMGVGLNRLYEDVWTAWIVAVAFSPNGQFLATASWDQTARLWSTALDDIFCQLCTGHGRNLLLGEWHGSVRSRARR